MRMFQVILMLTATLRDVVVGGIENSVNSAFGESIDVWRDYPPLSKDTMNIPLTNDSQISWVCEVEGIGLGLCDNKNAEFLLWRNDIFDDVGSTFMNVSLAPFKKPVGAFQSTVDGLIYVACFGTYPVPQNDSGVVIIDVSDADHPHVVANYTYPHPHHVHNIYEFYHEPKSNRSDVFLAILGNPWMDPPVPGEGLVMLDRDTGAFQKTTIERLNIRSAKQPAPGVFYALTQEPEPEQSKLVRLETNVEDSGEAKLVVRAETLLPSRDGGDGGADVILGLEPDTIWASDRWAGPGRLYYYSFNSSIDAPSGFVHHATHVATGENARYTVITDSGDMMVCSQNSGTLTLMEGLALSPTSETINVTTINTVGTVQFFIESNLIPFSEGQ